MVDCFDEESRGREDASPAEWLFDVLAETGRLSLIFWSAGVGYGDQVASM